MAEAPILIISKDFPRPSAELVEAYRGMATGPVVDAMGRRGALPAALRPLTKAAAFCGTALTVLTPPRDNLAPYAALTVARPGDVLVVAGGDGEASLLGDIAIGMAANGGIVAIVVDGLVRDLDGLEKVGIPVVARGLSPNSPFKNGPGEVGLAVAIGGVVIESGDIVLGDRDGVVVVPLKRAREIRAELDIVLAKEAAMEAAVNAGATQPEWLEAWLAAHPVRHVD